MVTFQQKWRFSWGHLAQTFFLISLKNWMETKKNQLKNWQKCLWPRHFFFSNFGLKVFGRNVTLGKTSLWPKCLWLKYLWPKCLSQMSLAQKYRSLCLCHKCETVSMGTLGSPRLQDWDHVLAWQTEALVRLVLYYDPILVQWRLWNFIVRQVKFKRFLQTNEPP